MNLPNAQNQVAEMMRMYQQDTPDKPTMPSEDVRLLRVKLMLEELLETAEALGVHGVYSDEEGRCYKFEKLAELVKKAPSDDWVVTDNADLTAVRDGIADQLVVVLGTAVACGINAEEAFNEVHRSNMSKLWTDEEVSNLTIYTRLKLAYMPIGTVLEIGPEKEFKAVKVSEQQVRSWLVKDRSGKVKKSESYSPANLKQFVME